MAEVNLDLRMAIRELEIIYPKRQDLTVFIVEAFLAELRDAVDTFSLR